MPSASPSAPTLARRLPAAALWLVGGRILGSVCTFGVLWQLARRLDLEPFGRLTFYLAVLAVMGSLVDLGTGATIVQESSRHPERLAGLLRTGRRVRLACAAVGTALWTTWALFAARADVPWVFASGAVCLSYSLELVAIPARNRMHLRGPVLVRAATSLATLLAITVCLQLGVRAVGPLLFAWSASAAAGHVALYILLRHELPDRAPAAAWRPFLRAALPLGIAALCQQLYFWVDNVFIRSAYGEDQLGLYNLPVRLFSFAILVAVLAPQAALPWLSRSHHSAELTETLRRVTLPLWGLGALAVGFLWPAGPHLLPVFGESFRASLGVLRILLAALFAVHVGALWVTTLIAMGAQNRVLQLAWTGLVVNLVGNALLLGPLGIEGAAWATAATEVWVAVAAAWGLARGGVDWRKTISGRALLWLIGLAAFGALLGSLSAPLWKHLQHSSLPVGLGTLPGS
ncbi:MAG: oligosaccharide flippase family protein [Planctomycetota bacterium]